VVECIWYFTGQPRRSVIDTDFESPPYTETRGYANICSKHQHHPTSLLQLFEPLSSFTYWVLASRILRVDLPRTLPLPSSWLMGHSSHGSLFTTSGSHVSEEHELEHGLLRNLTKKGLDADAAAAIMPCLERCARSWSFMLTYSSVSPTARSLAATCFKMPPILSGSVCYGPETLSQTSIRTLKKSPSNLVRSGTNETVPNHQRARETN
jgi:hypothetical protein